MKRFVLIAALAVAASASLCAQQRTAQEYQQRYALIVNRVGLDGVGVETLLNNWEKDYPEDIDMLCAKFNYYFTKSQSSEIVKKDQKKFLGSEPTLSLKDSLGAQVNYFTEYFYVDSLFAESCSAIDKAVRLKDNDLELRFAKITATLAYEKESPDMTLSAIKSLIDYNYTAHPKWIYKDETVDDAFFSDAIQEYCYSFYLIASPVSYECFKAVSEKMLKYNPKDADFTANLGSYCLAAGNDSKGAMKYYQKALKLDPSNYVASKNCVVIAKRNKDVKTEKKYLPYLIQNAQTDTEKQAAQARLNALNGKK